MSDQVRKYAESMRLRLANALNVAAMGSGTHHDTWVVDQMVRALCGGYEQEASFTKTDEYHKWVELFCGPHTNGDEFEWNEGVPP